jgi:hypothetical protein
VAIDDLKEEKPGSRPTLFQFDVDHPEVGVGHQGIAVNREGLFEPADRLPRLPLSIMQDAQVVVSLEVAWCEPDRLLRPADGFGKIVPRRRLLGPAQRLDRFARDGQSLDRNGGVAGEFLLLGRRQAESDSDAYLDPRHGPLTDILAPAGAAANAKGRHAKGSPRTPLGAPKRHDRLRRTSGNRTRAPGDGHARFNRTCTKYVQSVVPRLDQSSEYTSLPQSGTPLFIGTRRGFRLLSRFFRVYRISAPAGPVSPSSVPASFRKNLLGYSQ